MKLSVNEANFRGFRARNCATIEQVLILNFALGPKKLLHLSRNVLLLPPPSPSNYTDIGGCFRLRQIGPSEVCIILQIIRKTNPVISNYTTFSAKLSCLKTFETNLSFDSTKYFASFYARL